MPQIHDFEEFEHNGYTVTTDLGSAEFHFEQDEVTIQGKARGDGTTKQVEAVLEPEDSAEFNVSVSSTRGALLGEDLDFEAELVKVRDVETGDEL